MKVVIFLLIGAILAGSVAVYGLFRSPSTPQNVFSESPVAPLSDVTDEAVSLTGESTLVDLVTLGNDIECQISYVAEDLVNPVIGMYFVSGENIRGDFQIESAELGSFVSSVIYTDTAFYSWSVIDGQSYGVQIATSVISEVGSDALNEPVPTDVEVSYSCTEWESVDASIFQPPSDVLFQDISQILEGGMEFGTIYETETGEF